MQFKENPQPLKGRMAHLFSLIVFFSPTCLFSQTTYLPQGDKQNILLERMEIKLQKDSVLNFSKSKPLSRKAITNTIDRWYKRTLKMNPGEFQTDLENGTREDGAA